MSNRELTTILKSIRNERRGGMPHDVWVKRNREVLLMQIGNSTNANAQPGIVEKAGHLFEIFFPMEGMRSFAHAVGVFVLMVGTVLGGGLASAQVYAKAEPGTALYGVKLAVERAQLMLAPNAEYETGLHAQFADRRLDEAAKIAEQSPDQHGIVPAVLDSFNAEVASLAAGLDAMRHDEHPGVAETAKLMERKMAVYQKELRQVAASLEPQYRHSVVLSKDLVDGTALKAIAVIVDSHLANSAAVPRTVVDTKFEEQIQQAEAALATDASIGTEAKPATEKAKTAIAEAKQLLRDQDYKAALSKIEEVANLTKEAEAEDKDAETVTPTEEAPSVKAEEAVPAP